MLQECTCGGGGGQRWCSLKLVCPHGSRLMTGMGGLGYSGGSPRAWTQRRWGHTSFGQRPSSDCLVSKSERMFHESSVSLNSDEGNPRTCPKLCVPAAARCRGCVSPRPKLCVPGGIVAEVAEVSECCGVAYLEVKWQQSGGNEASCRKIFPKTSCPCSRAREEWQTDQRPSGAFDRKSQRHRQQRRVGSATG